MTTPSTARCQEENLELIANAAERIAAVLEKLLAYAEAEGGPIAQSGPNPPGGNPGPNH